MFKQVPEGSCGVARCKKNNVCIVQLVHKQKRVSNNFPTINSGFLHTVHFPVKKYNALKPGDLQTTIF